MHISCNWMRDFAPIELPESPTRLGEIISLAIAEVEGVSSHGDALGQVRVAEVLETEPHPNADSLKIATVNDGERIRRIVCGATNCRAGIKTPFADIGAQLPDTDKDGNPTVFAITPRKILGVESDGMLCSGRELQLSDDHDGIWILPEDAPVGTKMSELEDFRETKDVLLEIDNKSLTHRPDLWGHYGFARELSVVQNTELAPYPGLDPDSEDDCEFRIDNRIPDRCRRYAGLQIDGITVAPSPPWLAQRLKAVGMNSINNIVDVTNYVLLELGQPMHAFDVATLKDRQLSVRLAEEGETFLALDENEYTLGPADIVIADDGGAVALGGVMGGLKTGVTDSSTSIFLESANFAATPIRLTANRLDLRSDSSNRFEKSLDPEQVPMALRRAWQLIKRLCPDATCHGGIVDDFPTPFAPITIATSRDFLRRRLGAAVEDSFIDRVLTGLGFGLSGDLDVTVPSWRRTKDVAISEDIVEEVGRHFGFDNIVPNAPRFELEVPTPNPSRQLERQLKAILTEGHGFHEILCYPMIGAKLLEKFGLETDGHLTLTNPISEYHDRMRKHAVPQLIEAICENRKHHPAFKIFEFGRVYDTDAMDGLLPTERRRLTGAIVTPAEEGDDTTFFAAKSLVLDLLQIGGVTRTQVKPLDDTADPWVHPGIAAGFYRGRQWVASLYKLHPSQAEACGIRESVFLFEIDADLLAGAKRKLSYSPVSKYPSVRFEVTVIADKRELSAEIEKAIGRAAGKQLLDLSVITIYTGVPIPPGKKAISYRMHFAADHTLNGNEVTAVQDKVIAALVRAGYPLKA
jgi:phenylalanyl-tRNA synthetase beta chain